MIQEDIFYEITNNESYKYFIVKNNEYVNTVDNIIKELINDLIIIDNLLDNNNEIIYSLNYQKIDNELTITVKLIQSSSILDDNLFKIAEQYYDKYEEILITNNFHNLIIDFDVSTKNENVKVIRVYTSE